VARDKDLETITLKCPEKYNFSPARIFRNSTKIPNNEGSKWMARSGWFEVDGSK
jgi:hypothetical protein